MIKLYSQRKQEKGFKYSPDSFMQHELEASFIYEDTPDQLKATQEVKADMESDRPMDRLVCGDVGFGKTEVAIRAAFKAVADNKQVAVLVPTTVLAYQHYQTFCKRLEGMPCKVEYLSRARTAKDTSRILKELEAGTVNILIGTHKIIGKSVKFHDLGLLIIDEEQKFGVSVKEKLRQIKVNVDTLTMTATPIPRTLQFSLMGARDLSVIQTPPPNRYPIQTEVHTFNEEIITEAINFEMSRNGQVFFVNNRIQNLMELKAMIVRNIPDCRVCIGHGQMQPEELEKIIFGFVNYDYDVLLATTIIESGIDIPNANTIIINQAQNFGLSDLHQMRGRVGRSNKKAFCYLLAPPLQTAFVFTHSALSSHRLGLIESWVGAPCYWGNMPGQLKIIFDRIVYGMIGEDTRGLPLPLHKGKKAILISTSTTPFPFNILFGQSRGAIKAMREILKWSGFKVVSAIELGGTRQHPAGEKVLNRCRKAIKKLHVDMAETDNSHNLRNRLLGRIHENDIHELCHVIQCCEDHSLLEQLYTLLFDSEKRVADNAAWLFTHLDAAHQGWLYPKCDELMQEAMSTSSETKRRLLLTLLVAQPLCEDNLRTDFLDFCMNQMISSGSSVGVRALSMKLSFLLCRLYPELLAEFSSALEMLDDTSPLTPALRVARKNILKKIH